MTKRELIEPDKGDKRFARRDDKGHFTDDQTDVGRSLAADQRQHSKTPAKKGEATAATVRTKSAAVPGLS
jgi:hypothetical protein